MYASRVIISVIGLGKLGLPLAALLAHSGNKVRAFDKNESLMHYLIEDRFFSTEPELMETLRSGKENLLYTNDIVECISSSRLICIIVPTPSKPNGEFSNDFLIEVVTEIGRALHGTSHEVVINIVSTVMPGSCDSELRGLLELHSGRRVGIGLGLCYNPEFIALGSVIQDMRYPDMHLIGQSEPWAGQIVSAALRSIVLRNVPISFMTLTEAELVKIAINNYVTMKISFANSLHHISNAIGGLNIDVVTNAIGMDSRIGLKYLRAAAPFGGPCFPRDTRALSALFQKFDLPDLLPNATSQINQFHSSFIVQEIESRLKTPAKIGVIGISYKPGTNVTEESPAVNMMMLLLKKGYQVGFFDDEGAQAPKAETQQQEFQSISALIEWAEFILITRTHRNDSAILDEVSASQKPFLDLWRSHLVL
jgi:UDPglucose 6-dehydrogenase